MKTPSASEQDSLRAAAEIRRELARWDRVLFGLDQPTTTASLNAQFYHLWERVLMRLVEAMSHDHRASELARVEKLAADLERAQERGQLPPRLVRELVPRYPHG